MDLRGDGPRQQQCYDGTSAHVRGLCGLHSAAGHHERSRIEDVRSSDMPTWRMLRLAYCGHNACLCGRWMRGSRLARFSRFFFRRQIENLLAVYSLAMRG